MPSKTQKLPKKGGSKKKKILMVSLVAIVVALAIWEGLVLFNFGSNVYHVNLPSASSFQTKEWMNFIPQGVEAFRFLNITQITSVPGIVNSTELLNLTQLGINVSPYDVQYGIEVSLNGTLVHVMAFNETYADYLSSAFENSSMISLNYRNVTIYYLSINPETGEGGAWACVDRKALIFSGQTVQDLSAVKGVVGANSTSFFNTDQLKIGYLLTSNNKDDFVFSYYAWTSNSNNIDFEMRSAANPTQPEARDSFHFQTQQDFDNSYDYFMKNVLSSANSIIVSPTFLMETFQYTEDQVYTLFYNL